MTLGRIVGRAGAALQLGDCRATGRGHLAHKGHTDALHVCSGWRRILRCPLDMIIRAVKKLISTSVFGCPRLYFFALRGEQTSRAASRRGVRPGGAFYFRTPNHGTPKRTPRRSADRGGSAPQKCYLLWLAFTARVAAEDSGSTRVPSASSSGEPCIRLWEREIVVNSCSGD